MGAGRKKQTLTLGERTEQAVTVNGSVSARNLRKDKLGGVIFGCTHDTIRECISNQIFGLPALHFSYIRNIEPGLPLFLFNYSDRKLHGIYEATSYGKMNINPYGWTPDGSERTQFPAQVRFCTRMHCQPLVEDQYKKIIFNNYYKSSHFWFELDRRQSNQLISLFESLPVRRGVAAVPNEESLCRTSHITVLDYDMAHKSQDSEIVAPNNDDGSSKLQMESSLPTKSNWADLFKADAGSDKKTMDGSSKLSSEVDSTDCNQLDEQAVSLDVTHCFKDNFSGLNQFQVESCSSDSTFGLDEEKQNLETSSDREIQENDVERTYLKMKQLSLDKNDVESGHVDVDFPCEVNDKIQNDEYFFEEGTILEEKYEDLSVNSCFEECTVSEQKYENFSVDSFGLQSVLYQLREEMEGLKASSIVQKLKINVLEKKLDDSDIQVQHLKDRVKFLESQLDPFLNPVNELRLGTDKLVFIMGGYDGTSWLSTLTCYCPSRDISKQLKPMGYACSYASATVLNGRIYNFGGGNGNIRENSWNNTVECYEYSSDKWSSCPPLTHKKGCLASAAVCDKIFAIGGGNGVDCFSEVDMFDPVPGQWLSMQSMEHKRFASAAVELNGAIYVVGGYDGKKYLNSAEQLDPREAYWRRLPGMISCRGSHSLAVLNGKLYALGGYDGEKLISSVEVFDPRRGSWMQGDEMKQPKAHFVAAAIGQAIYVIGGMKEDNLIEDTVGCYKEGQGWCTTNLRGIGKRCFFSAAVL